MLDRLQKLWRDKTGASAIEFGLLAPVLLALFIGCVEVTFKIWSTQKAEKLVVTLADVIAQSQEVKVTDLTALVSSIDKIMDPFPFAANDGVVYISSVYLPQPEEDEELGDPIVNWQYKKGSYSAASKIGTEGSDAILPDDFELNERDNVIVAEVFYKYTPMAPGLMFDEAVVYRRAFFKPRLGALTDKPS
jgi:Flp pilus assembly pilin Flp